MLINRCDEEIFVNSLVFKMFEDWREREQPLLDEVGVSKNVIIRDFKNNPIEV